MTAEIIMMQRQEKEINTTNDRREAGADPPDEEGIEASQDRLAAVVGVDLLEDEDPGLGVEIVRIRDMVDVAIRDPDLVQDRGRVEVVAETKTECVTNSEMS